MPQISPLSWIVIPFFFFFFLFLFLVSSWWFCVKLYCFDYSGELLFNYNEFGFVWWW